jgi:hypothetical protein
VLVRVFPRRVPRWELPGRGLPVLVSQAVAWRQQVPLRPASCPARYQVRQRRAPWASDS